MVVLDPATLPDRLRGAGLTDVEVRSWAGGSIAFRARAHAQRHPRSPGILRARCRVRRRGHAARL